MTGVYDPFAKGPHRVIERTIHFDDTARNRRFPAEVWSPDGDEREHPLVLFSHAAAQGRRSATFLCSHLASHGYVVAAMDHSELVAPELARPAAESDEQRKRRWDAVIASRVPDIRLLLDGMIEERNVDETAIGLAGHSFGGWTVLAAAEADSRIRSVVAMAPAGAPNPKPGILPVSLALSRRDVPTLYLVAENDTSLPLQGMFEIFDSTPSAKLMVILRRADHLHFLDEFERAHEALRTAPASGDLAAIQKEMRPVAELHSRAEAHAFTRSLALAHFDATLRQRAEAKQFLAGDLEAVLAKRGIEARVKRA